MRNILLIIFLMIFTFSPALAEDVVVPETQEQVKLSFAPLVKKVAPAVVNIYTKRTVATGFRHPFMDDPVFGQFFNNNRFDGPMREQIEGSLGSGVIIQEDGLVVTNSHVIRGAEVITVGLADGREYDAILTLSDDASDLALLRIQQKDIKLPFVTLKPSESLEVGDLVLAVGNPFGVGQTVTSGIVSAQGRSSLDINDFNFFIQTDAAINPGNSGGPLVDMDGNVVGINTAIFSRSGGSMGIGFAIPSEMVASVVAAEKSGHNPGSAILRPWLGMESQDVTSDIASSLGMERPGGVLIAALHSASPLARAGLKVGDVILGLNGKVVRDSAEMKFRMATIPLGEEAKITVLRAGESFDVAVKAAAPPDDPPRNETVLNGDHALNGLTIVNVNPAVAVELGLQEEEGVVVLRVAPRSSASRFVSSGDKLLEINGVPIIMTGDVEKALARKQTQAGLALKIYNQGRISQIYVR